MSPKSSLAITPPVIPNEHLTLMQLIRQGLVMYSHPLKVYGLQSSQDYAKRVATELKIDLAEHEERSFDDGECYLKSVDGMIGNVRGHDVYVIQSLYSDEHESVADKFMKLIIFVGSLRSASADKITVVIPHLAWARQDRKTESRAPVTTKVVAAMLEAAGIDHAIFMDVHSLAAEQNAFSLRTPTDNLESKNLHARWCADHMDASWKIRVLTPDAGGYQRAVRFRNSLAKLLHIEIDIAVLDKIRVDGEVIANRIVGDIKDAQVIIYDDMISTAGTVAKAHHTVKAGGGNVFAICATHGLFAGDANKNLDEIDSHIVIADTVVPWRLNEHNRKKIHTVSTTKMIADAIWRIHTGTGSISELLS